MNVWLMVVAYVIVFVLSALVGATLLTLHSKNQQRFLRGTVPKRPAGFWKGSAPITAGWQGKKFDAKNNRGINILRRDGKIVERLPFKTSVGPSIQDDVTVVRIDYDMKGNPFWLRLVLDEIVWVGDKWLGKLQLRIIPGLPFSLIWFELRKP